MTFAEVAGAYPLAAAQAPKGEPLTPVRVGLWDQYGGSMPSGWVRWILEQFEFPAELVFPARLDQGDLNRQFDVLVFVKGAIPPSAAAATDPFRDAGDPPADLPAEYRNRLGRISDGTIARLGEFLNNGGRIVTIGSSTALARRLKLPIEDYLVERSPAGSVRPLPPEKFFVPASLLEVAVDPTAQSAYGMAATATVMFDESPVFRILPDGPAQGIKPVAWFATAEPLRSGWAWGQTYLEGGIAAAEARVGKGTLYLFGPEITFRSQPHGTYRFLFNGILGK